MFPLDVSSEFSHHNISKEVLLRYAVKGGNVTANIDGLVPLLLVFGSIPSFPVSNRKLPGKSERRQAIANARLEMGNIFVEQRITRAIKSNIPPAVSYDIIAGEDVLVYH